MPGKLVSVELPSDVWDAVWEAVSHTCTQIESDMADIEADGAAHMVLSVRLEDLHRADQVISKATYKANDVKFCTCVICNDARETCDGKSVYGEDE